MRYYDINPKGHEWIKDEDGDVRMFSAPSCYPGNHEGPRCAKCGLSFCYYCLNEVPSECTSDERVIVLRMHISDLVWLDDIVKAFDKFIQDKQRISNQLSSMMMMVRSVISKLRD